MRIRRGQAMMELVAGIFALTLVVSLLWAFVRYVAKSLEVQNHLRHRPAVILAEVAVDKFSARYAFGTEKLHIKEPYGDNSNPADCGIPHRRIDHP